MNQLEERMLSKKEASNYLGISTRTLERLIASGALKVVKIARSVKIHPDDLKRIMRNGAQY